MIEFLQKHHSSHKNLQFATSDVYDLQAAFDPAMPAALPVHAAAGAERRRPLPGTRCSRYPEAAARILANLPDDPKTPRATGLLGRQTALTSQHHLRQLRTSR